MTTLDTKPSPAGRIRIDTHFLLRQFPSLVQIRRKHRNWNDYGHKLASEMKVPAPTVREAIDDPTSSQASEWPHAKRLVHDVLATHESEHDTIRKRLGNLAEISTPYLLSTLGLWLAGALRISVSVTNPMIAVMLFAVAEAGGNWGILIDG